VKLRTLHFSAHRLLFASAERIYTPLGYIRWKAYRCRGGREVRPLHSAPYESRVCCV